MMDGFSTLPQATISDHLQPDNEGDTEDIGLEDELDLDDESYYQRSEDNLYDTSSDEDESDWNSDDDSPSGETKTTDQPHLESVKTNEGRKTQNDDRGDFSLSVLVTMPLDILYAIFGQVFPRDLLTLARTSKALRSILLSRNSTSTWKSARDQMRTPECPPDMSEPSWATLIFGERKCQICYATDIRNVKFALRRRLCQECFTKNVVSSFSFFKCFPNFDKTIVDLIPHTYFNSIFDL